MFEKNSHNLVTFVACCIPVLHKPLDVLSPNIHQYITKIISLATLYCNIAFFFPRNLGSRVIEYNWTDFGYKFEVSHRINEVWPSSTTTVFLARFVYLW